MPNDRPARDDGDDLQSYDDNLARLARAIKSIEAGIEDGAVAKEIRGDVSQFEDMARLALRDFIDVETEDLATNLSRFQNSGISAAAITAKGLIHSTNQTAAQTFGLELGLTLLDCGIEYCGKDQLTRQLEELGAAEPDEQSFGLLQVYGGDSHGTQTVVVSRLPSTAEAEQLFLILFAPKHDQDHAIELIASKFKLSSVEAEIAKTFMRGTSLRQIATDRDRSYTTIRNQFQTILEKTGCSSQSNLIQFATGLSILLANSKTILQPVEPELKGALHLPRPGGRKVEVLMSGDRDDTPVINLFSLFGPGITPEIEQKLRNRGVCLISPWRPGFSETDRPMKTQSRAACMGGDLTAVLDALEIEECAWLTRASASQSFYEMALLMPDRISRGVVVNGLVPRKYISGKSIASKWTNVLMGASIVSYPVARMILGAGERLMRRSDTVSFLQKMYEHSPSDCAVLGDPVTAASILNGVQDVVRQGLDAGVADLVSGFAPWDVDLDALDVPITLYHGVDDPNVPFDSVAEFARDNARQMTLVQEQGGGQLCYSHFDTTLDLLLQTVATSDDLPMHRDSATV